ncbi:MAG: SPOR domain-containing protein [Treponema sp.]|jgi:hypothetical protein|nr:SPOR domain-containing protein [Treponema sp.]
MKKIWLMAAALTAALLCTGASVWEGAAAVAPAGDLPDAGYYVATNSFPRNTVVDITNLETGKSVRVIVSSGLETPGLLAMISRDTASVIGMPLRSIGRIRMIQPSDPVAFSRFTEEMASSGDPDHDPQALIASEAPRQAAEAAPPAEETAPAAAPVSSEGITDLPGPPAPSGGDTPGSDASGSDAGIVREMAPAVVITESPNDAEESSPAETGTTEEVPETVYYTGERPREGVEIADEPAVHEVPPAASPAPGQEAAEWSYTLVPGDDRPPPVSPDHTLPPEAELEPLENRPPAEVAGTVEEPYPDEAYFINPVSPEPDRQDETAAGDPAEVPDEEAPAADSAFSVPVIAGLERGKYYLQIGAYSRVEAVESELSKIDRVYPVAVQNSGSTEKPVYRILLGPVNLGESGALLQRFKGMGYGDAFVRTAY